VPWLHFGWYGRNYWQCPKLKVACLLAAGCSAGVTVTAKLQTAEQLTEASECVGQLKALRVATVTSTYDLEKVSKVPANSLQLFGDRYLIHQYWREQNAQLTSLPKGDPNALHHCRSSPKHIYYEDLGVGQPVVLMGFSQRSFLKAGISSAEQGISSDHLWSQRIPANHRLLWLRHLCGRSKHAVTKLDLRDAVLVGFSMGTGEVTRYLGKGSERRKQCWWLRPPLLAEDR